MKTAIVCCLLVGCTSAWQRAQDVSAANQVTSTLVYLKDTRTGLCFAGRLLTGAGAVLTNVPCSDAVERAIAEQGQ
jgi:hypothetical protein